MSISDILLDFLRNLFSFDEAHPLLFTQFYFWAFFALVLAFFCLFKNRLLLRNGFLFFVSVFFYYKTSGWFTLILLFVTGYNFLAGRWIFRATAAWRKQAWVILSVIVNLSVLFYFKYSYFLVDVLNNLFGTHLEVFDVFAWTGNRIAGVPVFRVDDILLPVGISFYTFQAISYIMDIYRERVRPVSNILDFGFYVSFFPQLVAGPIVRANTFIPQLHKPFFLGRRQFGMAVFWILNGLAKKLILSDYIAVNFVDRVFETPLMYSGFETLMALFGYSMQVYADFSGYTDIAIGVAMLMGFYLPKNFNSPYKARNPGEFWKRWHISLSRWLQDYLYIPLGGNRKASFATYCCIFSIAAIGMMLSGSVTVAVAVIGLFAVVSLTAWLKPEKRRKITTNINAMNTMLLGGLWHGASWNFMIWGGLNGIGMVVFKFWRDWKLIVRILVISGVLLAGYVLCCFSRQPVFRMLFFWMALIWVGTVVRGIYHAVGCIVQRRSGQKDTVSPLFEEDPEGTMPVFEVQWTPLAPGCSSKPRRRAGHQPSDASARTGWPSFRWLETAWSVFLTFVFITFTRLFFRSGSNLDPAIANETAWNTAKNMVNQIGGPWDFAKIPQIIDSYHKVFLLILIGLIIHWIPENIKRRYRIAFAQLPPWLMSLIAALTVFVVYQFITADLQAFIYFQF